MKRKIAMFTVLFLFFNIVFGIPAYSENKNIDIKISTTKQYPENEAYDKNEKIYIDIFFEAEKISSGDTITITLPEQFEKNDLEFNILLDNSNESVGICQVKGDILKIIFNDNINSKVNVSGKIRLSRTIQSKHYTDKGVDLVFEYLGKVQKEHIETDPIELEKGEVFFKYGFTDGEHDEELFWRLIINPDKQELKNVKIEDILGEGQAFIKDSFVILKNPDFDETGDLDDNSDNGEVINLEDLKYNLNDTEFCIYLGDIDTRYCITYQVEKTKDLKEYENWAAIKADGVYEEYDASEVVEEGEGSLEGTDKIGQIGLIKRDADDNSIVLRGAEFELRDSEKKVIGKYKTNQDGMIKISDLKLDTNYYFVEINPPSGYELDSTPIEFRLTEDKMEDTLVVVNSKSIHEPDKPVAPEIPEVPEEPKEPETPEKPAKHNKKHNSGSSDSIVDSDDKDTIIIEYKPYPTLEPAASIIKKQDTPDVEIKPVVEKEPKVILYNKSMVPKTGRKSMILVYVLLALSGIQIIRMRNKKR